MRSLRKVCSQILLLRDQINEQKLGFYILGVFLFCVLALIKSPEIFFDPRFWAEEGNLFFQSCINSNFIGCLSYVHLGNFQFLTNLSIYGASIVDLRFSPYITTYLNAALHILVIVQMLAFCKAYSISSLKAYLILIAWTLLPPNYEVWMTSTNTQWLVGVSTFLIFAMPDDWIRQRMRRLIAWIIVCGLSGIPAVIMTPIALLRGFILRSRSIVMLALCLSFCGVVQTIIFSANRTSTFRAYSFDFLVFWLSTSMQTVIAPIASADFAQTLGDAINETRSFQDMTTLGSLFMATAIFLAIVFLAFRSKFFRISIYIVSSWLFVTFVQFFGSLGEDPWIYVSGFVGARYFLLGGTCLCLLLGLASTTKTPEIRSSTTALLLLIVTIGLFTMKYANWTGASLSGASWRAQVSQCQPESPCEIEIWPPGWKITVFRE